MDSPPETAGNDDQEVLRNYFVAAAAVFSSPPPLATAPFNAKAANKQITNAKKPRPSIRAAGISMDVRRLPAASGWRAVPSNAAAANFAIPPAAANMQSPAPQPAPR